MRIFDEQEPTQRRILKLIDERRACDLAYLKDNFHISPQSISYHTKILGQKNLISIERSKGDPRRLKLKITHAGSLLARWTG